MVTLNRDGFFSQAQDLCCQPQGERVQGLGLYLACALPGQTLFACCFHGYWTLVQQDLSLLSTIPTSQLGKRPD